MNFGAVVLLVFKALAALPKIGDQIRDAAAQIAAWYISSVNQATLSEIADAAAFAARAETDSQRYEAALRWQRTLRRPRAE